MQSNYEGIAGKHQSGLCIFITMLIATKFPILSAVLAHINVRFALLDSTIPLPGWRSANSAASPMKAKTRKGRTSADQETCHFQASVGATNTAPKKLIMIALRLPTFFLSMMG